MRLFQCSHCNSLVFFENKTCVNCGSQLGFDPTALKMLALQAPLPASQPVAAPASQTPTPALWSAKMQDTSGLADSNSAALFQLCKNALDYDSCNFLVAVSDPNDYCPSCRQTHLIPNLSTPGNLQAWTTIENAKRRLFYTLAKVGLNSEEQSPRYEFLEDIDQQEPILTGHANGLITLNIAEADDAERTRRRIKLHEPYRTLLGHLRHEVGHYYWDQFFSQDETALAECRALFGDERADYAQALEQHYQNPKPDWQLAHISQYASSHPWEDWAETWAHYLHLVDLQETAASYQLQFATPGTTGPIATAVEDPFGLFAQAPQDGSAQDIGRILNQTMGVSLLINSLNRSLGHNDAYPFALTSAVLEKLAFIHNAVRRYVHNKAPTQLAQLSQVA